MRKKLDVLAHTFGTCSTTFNLELSIPELGEINLTTRDSLLQCKLADTGPAQGR